MRRGLLWALMVTAALSALALWLDQAPAKVVAALDRSQSSWSSAAVPPRSVAASPATSPLPVLLEPFQLEAARRDIFVPVVAPAPEVASLPSVVAPPPPPAPTAPTLSWRYLGVMVTPGGQRLVMLARGDTTLTIQPGTPLDEGYVVEAIGPDAVRVIYSPLGTVVNIPIPPAPPSPR